MFDPNDADQWAKAWGDAQARAPFRRHVYRGSGWVKVCDSMAPRRRPTLKFFEFPSDTMAPSDELVRTYELYFDMVAEMDDEKWKKVRDYILARSSGGVYRMRINKQLALLCWRVQERAPEG